MTENLNKRQLGTIKRLVVKIGSSLLTDNGKGLHTQSFSEWAEQIAKLCDEGIEVILVSSGAIAEGVVRMNLPERPKTLPALQACAAIGQMGLIQAWSEAFAKYQLKTAQVLLTHDDLSNRERYLNTGQSLSQMLDWGVIPVINENDNIVIDEIRFGDNDTLGAMSASLVQADLYIILTDQQGVFTDNPSKNPEATLISQESAMADYLFDIAGEGGKLGSGGMLTKIKAARLASMSGCSTVIAHGKTDNIIYNVAKGFPHGTLLISDKDKTTARKRWLAAHLQTAGKLVLDDGAITAIKQNKKSLLPVGVKSVIGEFKVGDVVECVDQKGVRVAIGRVNFSSDDAGKITKEPSKHIPKILGKDERIVMIHRDYLALI